MKSCKNVRDFIWLYLDFFRSFKNTHTHKQKGCFSINADFRLFCIEKRKEEEELCRQQRKPSGVRDRADLSNWVCVCVCVCVCKRQLTEWLIYVYTLINRFVMENIFYVNVLFGRRSYIIRYICIGIDWNGCLSAVVFVTQQQNSNKIRPIGY